MEARDPSELPPELAEQALGEPGPDAAREDELALVVVDADEQAADARARSLRLGEAADDELLALDALDLEPVTRSTREVRAVAALADDALEPVFAGLLEEGLGLVDDVRGVTDRAAGLGGLHDVFEQPFPRLERSAGEVEAAVVKKVEHEIDERPLERAAAGEVLERLEAGGAVGAHDPRPRRRGKPSRRRARRRRERSTRTSPSSRSRCGSSARPCRGRAARGSGSRRTSSRRASRDRPAAARRGSRARAR